MAVSERSQVDPPTLAIEVSDLRVDYGDLTAVDGISMSIPRGEVFGLVGPNGAGKTSTIRVLATLLEPTYGTVRINGHDVFEEPSEVHRILGYMPDLAPVIGDLRVWELLDHFAAAHGLNSAERKSRVAEVLAQVQLEDKSRVFCKTLSRGMMQRVILAKTLLHQPSILILDEPASGMDPMARIDLRDTLRAMSRQGSTVLISSHILSELADICSSVGIMDRGKLVAIGPIDRIVEEWSQSGRSLVIRFDGDAAQIEGFLLKHELVTQADIHRHEARVFFTGEESDLTVFLKSLLDQGIAVREFFVKRANIEDVMKEIHRPGGSAKGGMA